MLGLDDDARQLVESGIGGRLIPEPYLFWNVKSEDIIHEFSNGMQKIRVHRMNITTSKSRPTGTDNESVQRKYKHYSGDWI